VAQQVEESGRDLRRATRDHIEGIAVSIFPGPRSEEYFDWWRVNCTSRRVETVCLTLAIAEWMRKEALCARAVRNRIANGGKEASRPRFGVELCPKRAEYLPCDAR